MGDRTELPTGTVTLLFTDIEGSTALLERLGDVLVGDCWLEIGRFSDAFTSYVRAARHAYVRRETKVTLSRRLPRAALAITGLERPRQNARPSTVGRLEAEARGASAT